MKKLAGVLAALVLAPLASGAAPAPRVVLDVGVGSARDVVSFAPDGSDFRDLSADLPTGSRLELDPSWSPDGTQLAFASLRDQRGGTELYVMNADGSAPTRLTFSQAMVSNGRPCWLPDGRIVWVRNAAQADELWVTNADGSGQRALTSEGGRIFAPACSPTSNEVAYGRQQSSGPGVDLRVVNAGTGEVRTIASAAYQGAEPAWSPDGTRIAFADGRLRVVGADGSGLREVSPAGIVGAISWSSDGTTIAATEGRQFPDIRVGSDRTGYYPAATSDIVSVDVATGAAKRLTGPVDDAVYDLRSQAFAPVLWPGGARLYFQSSRDTSGQGSELWQMNRDGTCETRVTPATNVATPRFRPDAPTIAEPLQCVDAEVHATLDKTLYGLRDVPRFVVTVGNDGNELANGGYTIATTRGVVDTPHGEGDCSGDVPVECGVNLQPETSLAATYVVRDLKAGTLRLTIKAHLPKDRAAWNDVATLVAKVLPCYDVGTTAADRMVGTNGNDRICALPGADHIYGGGGDDYIDAGNGNDWIYPGPGNDTVLARGGNDTIFARDGQRDWIDCGTEHDVVYADKQDVTRHCEKVLRR